MENGNKDKYNIICICNMYLLWQLINVKSKIFWITSEWILFKSNIFNKIMNLLCCTCTSYIWSSTGSTSKQFASTWNKFTRLRWGWLVCVARSCEQKIRWARLRTRSGGRRRRRTGSRRSSRRGRSVRLRESWQNRSWGTSAWYFGCRHHWTTIGCHFPLS